MIPVLIYCFRERKETRGKDKQANLLRWMVANLWLVYDDGSCPPHPEGLEGKLWILSAEGRPGLATETLYHVWWLTWQGQHLQPSGWPSSAAASRSLLATTELIGEQMPYAEKS